MNMYFTWYACILPGLMYFMWCECISRGLKMYLTRFNDQ